MIAYKLIGTKIKVILENITPPPGDFKCSMEKKSLIEEIYAFILLFVCSHTSLTNITS